MLAHLKPCLISQTSSSLCIRLRNVQSPASMGLLKNVVWSISNLCRGNPRPDFALVRDCIPAMVYAMTHVMSSTEARVDALWTLSYLSDGEEYRIQAIVDCGDVIPTAMVALESEKAAVMAPALRILGNIVTGNAEQTQAVLDAGILSIAPKLLESGRVRTLLFICPSRCLDYVSLTFNSTCSFCRNRFARRRLGFCLILPLEQVIKSLPCSRNRNLWRC